MSHETSIFKNHESAPVVHETPAMRGGRVVGVHRVLENVVQDQWRAGCTCGWNGENRSSLDDAQHDADSHVEEAPEA